MPGFNKLQNTKRLDTFKSFEEQLYQVNDHNFENIALELFRIQAFENPVYSDYLKNLSIDSSKIDTLNKIPFLPISFFKSHALQSGSWEQEAIFLSSGTTGTLASKHSVKSIDQYLKECVFCFEHFFGSLTGYHFLALLPSYLEREGSSLICMMDHFIKKSESASSGFYLNNYDQLAHDIGSLQSDKRKTILWGVTFALLDFGEKYNINMSQGLVFETGGMKGRGKELTKQELHKKLSSFFDVDIIYSEYGMTELFSQAYSKGGNKFCCPPSLRVISRDLTDPFHLDIEGIGGLNVIDLANIHTLAFIETEDLGKVYEDGSFEVLGRMDNSDVRGCNLMLSGT